MEPRSEQGLFRDFITELARGSALFIGLLYIPVNEDARHGHKKKRMESSPVCLLSIQ